jgi:hypothetical protein
VALPAGVAEAVPTSFLLPDVSLPCYHTCQPSAAAPRPRPLRCGLQVHRARRVKAAQEGRLKSGGALALALTAVLRLGSRTEAASSKGSQRA